MDNLDNNPPTTARGDEELAILVWNEEQSATPYAQHARILHYYPAMISLPVENILLQPNMGRMAYSPIVLPLFTRGGLQHNTAVVTTTTGFTLQANRRFGRYCGVWLAVVAVYIAMCAYLLAYTQLKTKYFPVETQLGFIIMSLAALFMTLFTSGILVYTNNNLQSLMKQHFSPVYDVILKSVLWFSFILTPLSLLLLLFVPHKFSWTGYLIVCVLFAAILAFNFHSLKRKLASRRI